MARRQPSKSGDYQIRVRGVRRRQPDLTKIARAVIALALQEAAREADAQRAVDADHGGQTTPVQSKETDDE